MYFATGEIDSNAFHVVFPTKSHIGGTSEIKYFGLVSFNRNVKVPRSMTMMHKDNKSCEEIHTSSSVWN